MSPPALQKVTIIGATGHIGQHLISAFTSSPNFHLSIISRDHSSNSNSSPPNFPSDIPIHRITGNYDTNEPQLIEILTGQDILISAIAAQAIGQQNTIIDAAIKAGVKHFVPSEFGHDTRNKRAAKLLPGFICAGKREIVQYLRSKEGSGLRWTAFVTGPVFEMAVFQYLGYDLNNKQASLLDDGTHRWSTTTLSAVALAVKNAMLIPDKTANRYLFIESFNISQRDILAALEDLTNAPWAVSYHGAEEGKRAALEKLLIGDYSGIPVLMRYVTCTEGCGGDYMEYEEGANNLLSLPEESLSGALAGVVR
ncbi:hypothetical protein BJX76DRAFT_329587 [Aspergillus varians]